jgi:enoyl-CoA hydratase/carnithine racemase
MAEVSAFATLRYEKRGALAIVTLDRPEVLNAYNVAMRDDLFAVLGAAHDDPEVRVLVLRGRGPAFSTGGDLSEFGTAPSPLAAREARWRRDVWGRLLELRAATVAAVHGYTVGGGMEMALLCDLCVAADDTRLALPESGLGMIPGVAGTQTLPRRAGLARALDVTLAGRWLDARTALRWGVVHRVEPRARLESTALALARRLAALDPGVVHAARRAVRAALDGSLEGGIALERRLALGLERRRTAARGTP